jgi:hypothetical protein
MLIARKPSRTGSLCAEFTKDPLPSDRSTGMNRFIAAMAQIHAFRAPFTNSIENQFTPALPVFVHRQFEYYA